MSDIPEPYIVTPDQRRAVFKAAFKNFCWTASRASALEKAAIVGTRLGLPETRYYEIGEDAIHEVQVELRACCEDLLERVDEFCDGYNKRFLPPPTRR